MKQLKNTDEHPENLLKAENLFYTYEGERFSALSGLSLTVKRGKKIACMGSNGSGKSTFFLCCNGIHKPDSGTLYYNGRPLGYTRKELLSLRQKVGIVFQDPDRQLFAASVRQEISFGLLNLGCPETKTRQKVTEIMDELGITPYSHKPVHALSGGQKKLVSIADILVMEPELIILDEPAAALDPFYTKTVRHIIERITAQGITVMMATHDVDYAYGWADEILLFSDGKLLKQGTPAELFSDETLLKKAHLTQPAVLTMFYHLKREGIIKNNLRAPGNLKELQSYLSQRED